MRLKKLSIKNIRSYEEQTILFPEGSLLLAGDVGSGKTTILLAIEYALFGLQPGQKGSSLLRNNENNAEVSLECEIAGNNVIIERKLKRDNNSITSDYSSITINGEVYECSVTELKTKILSLLGYPSEFVKRNNLLYRYTVYTPQEQMKQIILEDSETRLNVLRHIFGMDKYKRIRENLASILSYFKEESKILQGEIKTLDSDKTKISLLKERILSIERKIRDKESLFKSQTEQRKRIEEELKKVEENIKEKEKFEKEVEKTDILISSKKDNLSSAISEISEIRKSLLESKEAFSQNDYEECQKFIIEKKKLIEMGNTAYLELLSKLSSAEKFKKENLEKKERIFGMKFCPTCLQDVSMTHKHNILNETEAKVTELIKELNSLEESRIKLAQKNGELKSDLDKLYKRKSELEILKTKTSFIEQAKKRLDILEKNKESLKKDLELLSKHNLQLKSEILKFSKYDVAYRKKQEELKQSFILEKNSEILIAESKKEKEITLKEISSLNDQILDKEKKAERLKGLLNIMDWLSNYFTNLISFTENQIMIKLRREFSNIFSKWFYIVGGESFSIQLDENFTPIILQGEIEMDYSFLSGGERTAVALAYRLALNQVINSILSQIKTRDIVILDEPTEGFSEAQIDKIREVLNELKVKQLIIVSHEQKIESFVDNVVRLKKEGEVSRISQIVNSV